MVKSSEAVARLSKSQRATKLTRPPSDVLTLATGDPSFATPAPIVEALVAALEAGYTHYPAPIGDTELRETVAADLTRRNGTRFETKDILITNGAAAAIYASMVAFLNAGDEVLLHDPSYSLYWDVAGSIGATPVFVPWNKDLRLDVEAMERAVTPRTRMFVLNNPVNPTGIVFTRSEMEAIADFVRRHDLVLIADEAYDHLVFDGREVVSAAGFDALADRAIIINTCSKRFAMTGWRIGYVAAREGLVRGPALMHRTMNHTINSAAQRAAIAAFHMPDDWSKWMLGEYTRRRDVMCDLVNAMPGLRCEKPEGTFYVFVRCDVPLSSQDLTAHCMRHGVAVRSGTEFGDGGEGYVRLTFAGEPADFEPALHRLGAAMQAIAHESVKTA
jgi:aspartate/methionine/tyrosine aminotransferase